MMTENDIGKYLIFNPCGEVSKNTRPLSTRKNIEWSAFGDTPIILNGMQINCSEVRLVSCQK